MIKNEIIFYKFSWKVPSQYLAFIVLKNLSIGLNYFKITKNINQKTYGVYGGIENFTPGCILINHPANPVLWQLTLSYIRTISSS